VVSRVTAVWLGVGSSVEYVTDTPVGSVADNERSKPPALSVPPDSATNHVAWVVTRRGVCGFGTRFRAVGPTPPRLLANRTASKSSLSLGHCSGSVATRSLPDWVPGCRSCRGTSVACASTSKPARARNACEGGVTGGAENFGRCREKSEAGEDEVRCCAVADAVAVRCRAVLSRSRLQSNIPFVPDRVAVLVLSAVLSPSPVLSQSRSAVLSR
jgi:hypothetical protein